MNRREFTGHLVAGAGVLALGGSTFLMSGCGSVFNDILNWIPVGEAALNSILAVLTANGVLISPAMQSTVALIEAGFNALAAAIKEYESTTPPPVGALAKIEAAFKAVTDSFTTFLKSLNVNGGVLAIIVGLAQIIFSTVAAFLNKLPASSSLRRTIVLGAVVEVGTYTAPIVPKNRTRRAFKKDWNSTLSTGAKIGAVCPPSAYLKLTLLEHL